MIKKIRLWKRCQHKRVECLHGDQIIFYGFARARCRDCGRALKGRPLPEPCTVTGHPHHRALVVKGKE